MANISNLNPRCFVFSKGWGLIKMCILMVKDTKIVSVLSRPILTSFFSQNPSFLAALKTYLVILASLRTYLESLPLSNPIFPCFSQDLTNHPCFSQGLFYHPCFSQDLSHNLQISKQCCKPALFLIPTLSC